MRQGLHQLLTSTGSCLHWADADKVDADWPRANSIEPAAGQIGEKALPHKEKDSV
jgi:hypothetical protein